MQRGIVDENVKPLAAFFHAAHHGGRFAIAHIADLPVHASAVLICQLLAGPLKRVPRAARDGDMGTLFQKSPGDGTPDAPAPSGHKRMFAFERKHLRLLPVTGYPGSIRLWQRFCRTEIIHHGKTPPRESFRHMGKLVTPQRHFRFCAMSSQGLL